MDGDGRELNLSSRAEAVAVLLDRDGVITEPVLDPLIGTHESPLHPDQVSLVGGAAQAIAELRARGLVLVVVSNQPAAAKATVPMCELRAVHDRTVELLAAEGVRLDGWEYCFHHPAGVIPELRGACDCRKPRPGLLLRALADRGLEPGRAWMVGDADSDIAAGASAGTRTALIEHPLTGHRRRPRLSISGQAAPEVATANLLQFARSLGRGAEVA